MRTDKNATLERVRTASDQAYSRKLDRCQVIPAKPAPGELLSKELECYRPRVANRGGRSRGCCCATQVEQPRSYSTLTHLCSISLDLRGTLNYRYQTVGASGNTLATVNHL